MISNIMACLDRSDRRGNRASVGQILDLLKDPKLAAVFPESEPISKSQPGLLETTQCEYRELQESKLMQNGRRLRDDAIAHILIREDATPVVRYEALYELHDMAERLVMHLYEACDRGQPQFLRHEPVLTLNAKVFWDIYFAGKRAGQTQAAPDI